MSPSATAPSLRVDYLFASVLARTDRWADLNNAGRVWAARAASKDARQLHGKCAAALEELRPLEDYYAYPGPRLLAALQDRVRNGDAAGTTRLVQRIATSLMNRSYRRDPSEWELDEEPSAVAVPMPTAAGEPNGRPYFEALFVTPTPPTRWATHGQQVRKLRRPQDQFAYEPVFVGSFEDAVLAVLLNASVQSVVLYEGFVYESSKDAPLLREMLARALQVRPEDVLPGELGVLLARVVKALRPRSTSSCSPTAAPRTSPPRRRRRACAASSTKSRSRSNCTCRSSPASPNASRRRSSTT